MFILAAISITSILWSLFVLLLVLAAFGLIWYAVDYLARTWEIPDFAVKVVRTILVLALVGILLLAIISLANPNFIAW